MSEKFDKEKLIKYWIDKIKDCRLWIKSML